MTRRDQRRLSTAVVFLETSLKGKCRQVCGRVHNVTAWETWLSIVNYNFVMKAVV